MMNVKLLKTQINILITLTLIPLSAMAQDREPPLSQKYETLKAEVARLTEQLNSLESKMDEANEKIEESSGDYAGPLGFGSGDSSFHLAGYADVNYTDAESGDSTFDVGKFNPIFHYQYKDKILLESEFEFTFTEAASGAVTTKTNLEYLSIDYFLNDYVTFVAGKFLSPIGQFRQNLHPSWINKSASAPAGFGHDGAAPLADIGLQMRGGFPVLEKMKGSYSVYVGNGPRFEVEKDGAAYEIHGMNTDGIVLDDTGNKTFGGRLGFLPIPNFEIGLSGASGKATNKAGNGAFIKPRGYSVYGADFYYSPKFLKNAAFRGEYVKTSVNAGTAAESDPSAKTWEAFYLQGSYKFDSVNLEPVFRYGEYAAKGVKQTQWMPGINYLVTNNFICKVAYEFNDNEKASSDNNRLLLQATYGF